MSEEAVRAAARPGRSAVITITHGRDEHLNRQRLALAANPPDLHVVVGMDDRPDLPAIPGAPDPVVTRLPPGEGGLPLAEARNTGARLAVDEGATTLVFLDVDCIPGPQLLRRYRQAAAQLGPLALLSGPVAYLPPPAGSGYPTCGLDELAPFHPARPVPADGQVVAESRFELFWSLSFCVSSATWDRLGGFHQGYSGYGAEDTDFAMTARQAGAQLFWVGGAEAFHQHHEPSRDDPTHQGEMVRNAQLFHRRHGWWPMRDWLENLPTPALVNLDPERNRP
jgi:GT2 family glycosyltransferase